MGSERDYSFHCPSDQPLTAMSIVYIPSSEKGSLQLNCAENQRGRTIAVGCGEEVVKALLLQSTEETPALLLI